MRAELRSAQTEAEKAQFDYDKAEASRDAQNPDPGTGTRIMDQQILDLQADIRTNQAEVTRLNTAPPAGMSDEAIERTKAHYSGLIDASRGRIGELVTKRGELDDILSNANARRTYYNSRVTTLRGTPAAAGPPIVRAVPGRSL